jgi:hypothetical protein
VFLHAQVVADSNPIQGNLEDRLFFLVPNKITLENKYPLSLHFNIDQKACKKNTENAITLVVDEIQNW